MDERRLRNLLHFNETDLAANRQGQFSEGQKKRLDSEARKEQRSSRESAAILFVIAAAGLAVGIIVGSVAPTLTGRILMLAMMAVLWPAAWAGKGINILLAAKALQQPRLRAVSGPVHILYHGEGEYTLEVQALEFDVDGNPSGALMDGDEITIYYVEATEEIFSVEGLERQMEKRARK